jgi:hypothetical protein
MDTNRTLFKAFVASLALLLASGVSAQTIYKQVDEEGRVTFTDRPNPSAKVITSYETRGRAPSSVETQPTPRYEQPREANEIRVTTDTSMPRTAVSSFGASRSATATAEATTTVVQGTQPVPTQPAVRANYGEVERAVATYTPLNTPLAMQADANEAARRARQDMNKGSSPAPILVVQAAPRDHEATAQKSGVGTLYFLWVVTFFILAAGLLYVGWQVLRLILGTAFPRFHVGAA